METISNKIFFGCNYNDKKIKTQFDQLKNRLEDDFPITCVVIDKRAKKSAKDLWLDIQTEVKNSAACIFDVTGFRPNVILELGFALAIKNNDQIFITFRERKTKGKKPDWLLSDITHLNRFVYTNVPELEKFCKDQIKKIKFYTDIENFKKSCKKTGAADKYYEFGIKILKVIRDEGQKSDDQIKTIIEGSNCRLIKILALLKQHQLLKKEQGRYGRYFII